MNRNHAKQNCEKAEKSILREMILANDCANFCFSHKSVPQRKKKIS